MRFTISRKLLKRTALFFAAVVCLFLIGIVSIAAKCASVRSQLKPLPTAARERGNATVGIKDYSRPAEDTYLTYPEWYIVWSYQEKADFQETHLPSTFPYLASIQQYWRGYCCAYGITRGRYPFNAGDHLMLMVIGSSFSVEYILKGAYENTIGRLSESLSSHKPVEEDAYAYKVAREYAAFVHIRPFYEFSFASRLKGLWKETSLSGPHNLRKWERKAFLSLDYAVEAVYCAFIEKATHSVYGIEGEHTDVWIENTPINIFKDNPRVQIVREISSQAYVVSIPRYQEFTDVVYRLAKQDVHFVEVAGNDEILLTAIAPGDWTYDLSEGQVLFSTEMLTRPKFKRIAVATPVRSLHTVLNQFGSRGIQVEHVYDY